MFVYYMQMYSVNLQKHHMYIHISMYIPKLNNPTSTLSVTYLHKGSKSATASEQTN